MTPEQMIKEAVKQSGMTIKAVSDRSGVRYSCLQPSLQGRRELRADEYLKLCGLLNLDPRGFQESQRGA